MAVKYRLGLNVSTASIGAAAVSLDNNGQPDKLIWHHVRIFKEPLINENGTLISKKAERRLARNQRRQYDRRASRLRRIAHLSSLIGLKREEIAPDEGRTLPRLRALAAIEPVELADLLRIFLRMSKRRGFKGDFNAKKKGKVAEGSSVLRQTMRALAEKRGIELKNENDTGITLGQYLFHRLENGLTTKLRIREYDEESKGKKEQSEAENSNGSISLYALRKMVEHEFDTIWQTQAKHHDILNGVHNGKPIRDHFREAIFYQRPLKPFADLVARCELEPTLPRSPRAQMAFQRYRIEKTLVELRWGAGKRAESLTFEQKQIIRNLLDKNGKVKFDKIYEVLEKAGCAKPQGRGLHHEQATREELLGNSTLAALRNLDKHSKKHHPERAADLENQFRALDAKTQISVINFLAEIGSPEQLDDSEWHTCFIKRDGMPRQFSDALVSFVNSIKDHDHFDRLSKMDFDGGRSFYSVKALNNLADWLQEPEWPGDWQADMMLMDIKTAIRVCYPHALNRKVEPLAKLPMPESTCDEVVDGSLRQVRWVVNKMIAELGTPPDEIVVKMAREMSLGTSRRNELTGEKAREQKKRRDAAKAIQAYGQTPTPTKICRYLQWAEQDKSFCPYCNETINIAEALSEKITDYDHITPKSLSQIGMRRSELVLAHHSCNREKGDRTPWDAWGDGRNAARWQSVEVAAMHFENTKLRQFRKAKLLRTKDFEREVLTENSVIDFVDHQFYQPSWVAFKTIQWLQCLCPNKVSVLRGGLIAMQRRAWKLETVIPEVRIESNLPVLDHDGRPIGVENFARLKKYLEGETLSCNDCEAHPEFDLDRSPDNRIDHRYHLINAITLALTSRELYQKMAENYKTAAEKLQSPEKKKPKERQWSLKNEARLCLEVPEPPMRNVRVAALDAVRQCLISVKPDRYPDGAMFRVTAYGLAKRHEEERLWLTLRQPVSGLGKVQGKANLETVRKVIANIVSDDVRRIVGETFEDRIARGMEAGEALALPILHPLYSNPIRKVRCFETYADFAQPIIFSSRQGEHKKYLINAGYAYLKLPTDNTREPRLVTIRKAIRDKKNPVRQDELRIYKGDTVLDPKSQKKFVVKHIKSQEGCMLAMALISENRPITEMSAKEGRQQPSGKSLTRFKLV